MKNADQPAYPIHPDKETYSDTGLTKREYFAAMAMQGMIATGKYTEGIAYSPNLSKVAIEIADELLNQIES